jgi:NADH-quinone oxidoreductase subunit E
MTETHKTHLSDTARAEIDSWAQRYPANERRSAVMEALRIVQNENGGWLTVDLMDAVADYLGMPRIAVYEVVSFYTMYNTKPVGRHIINVCTNISCMLCDSKKIVDHLKKRLEINLNETTQDGRFTLREVECLAACTSAPVMQIGKKYHEHLTPEKVDAILEELE